MQYISRSYLNLQEMDHMLINTHIKTKRRVKAAFVFTALLCGPVLKLSSGSVLCLCWQDGWSRSGFAGQGIGPQIPVVPARTNRLPALA